MTLRAEMPSRGPKAPGVVALTVFLGLTPVTNVGIRVAGGKSKGGAGPSRAEVLTAGGGAWGLRAVCN